MPRNARGYISQGSCEKVQKSKLKGHAKVKGEVGVFRDVSRQLLSALFVFRYFNQFTTTALTTPQSKSDPFPVMSTNASGPAAPSHTCSDRTFAEREKLGDLGAFVEIAKEMRDSDEDQDLDLGVANSVVSSALKKLEEFEKKIQKSKETSCPACSVSCCRWRL